MKTSKKMILSVLAMVLTFIALGTTTFAWFSLSTVSKVSQITGSVKGGEGLEIRLVAVDEEGNVKGKTPWKSNLSDGDFAKLLTDSQAYDDLQFNAISTEDGIDFTKMGTDGDKSVVNFDEVVTKNKDYMVIKIQFKSDTEGTVIFESYELTGDGSEFTPELPYNQTDNANNKTDTAVVADPSNGARFTLKATKGNDGSKLKAYQKPETVGNESINNSTIYSIEDGKIVGNTANNDALSYGQYSFLKDAKAMEIFYKTNGANKGLVSEGDALNYEGAGQEDKIKFLEAAQGTKDGQNNLTKVDLVENIGDDKIADLNDEEVFVAEIEIQIWLEGWDVDTYDVLYLGELSLELVFRKEEQ